jgi:hypothetical protein
MPAQLASSVTRRPAVLELWDDAAEDRVERPTALPRRAQLASFSDSTAGLSSSCGTMHPPIA